MTDRVPSFFLLVPGPWREASEILDVLTRASIEAVATSEASIEPAQIRVDIVHDDALGDAITFGRRGRLPDDIVSRASACTCAALIEIGSRLDEDPTRIAKIGRALKDAGGVAVRNEASGGASTWEPWIDQLESGDPDRIYASAVVIVGDDEEVFTCGMQQFDLPDAEMPNAATAETISWLEIFCAYQIAEQPTLASGHTFAPAADLPRRKLERWPDHRHHPSDGRHNPFGLWRFLPPGDAGLDALDPVPIPIPTLFSILLAAERSKGPLNQSAVEAITDSCTAIAMSIPDAIALERARGYADLEPRRAWPQWQLVRSLYAR
jgi:hypothetical protein